MKFIPETKGGKISGLTITPGPSPILTSFPKEVIKLEAAVLETELIESGILETEDAEPYVQEVLHNLEMEVRKKAKVLGHELGSPLLLDDGTCLIFWCQICGACAVCDAAEPIIFVDPVDESERIANIMGDLTFRACELCLKTLNDIGTVSAEFLCVHDLVSNLFLPVINSADSG